MIKLVTVFTFGTMVIALTTFGRSLSRNFLLPSSPRPFLPTPTVRPKLPVSPTYLKSSPLATYPQTGRQYAILRSESFISPDNNHYQYVYETENGISAHEQGDLVGSGKDAGISATGGYQYTSPEGVPVQIDYLADVNGFQPSGNVLPTPPPVPPAILRAIQYIESHPQPQETLLTRKYN